MPQRSIFSRNDFIQTFCIATFVSRNICYKLWMNKEQFTRAGLEPATSGLTCWCSTNSNKEIFVVQFVMIILNSKSRILNSKLCVLYSDTREIVHCSLTTEQGLTELINYILIHNYFTKNIIRNIFLMNAFQIRLSGFENRPLGQSCWWWFALFQEWHYNGHPAHDHEYEWYHCVRPSLCTTI